MKNVIKTVFNPYLQVCSRLWFRDKVEVNATPLPSTTTHPSGCDTPLMLVLTTPLTPPSLHKIWNLPLLSLWNIPNFPHGHQAHYATPTLLTDREGFLHQAIRSIFHSVNRTILVIRSINHKALCVCLLLDRKLETACGIKIANTCNNVRYVWSHAFSKSTSHWNEWETIFQLRSQIGTTLQSKVTSSLGKKHYLGNKLNLFLFSYILSACF